MNRYFEKISFKQFCKDIGNKKDIYDAYTLPRRSTKNSAGYDFVALEDYAMKVNEIKKIPLGIKVNMCCDEMLMIVSRSSMGFKHNIRLTNQIGIIDSDYYNNIDNEGHIWISLQNHGNSDYTIKQGDNIVQGIFVKYLKVDNEDEINSQRISGIGSTNKED